MLPLVAKCYPGWRPLAGVRKVSLREEAYRLLQELQRRYGATSLSDTVLLLAEKARQAENLDQRLQEVEHRLEELEATCRKTYLAVLRLLEELTGRSGEEGPESPAGGAEGVKSADTSRDLPRPSPVRSSRGGPRPRSSNPQAPR